MSVASVLAHATFASAILLPPSIPLLTASLSSTCARRRAAVSHSPATVFIARGVEDAVPKALRVVSALLILHPHVMAVS